MPSTHQERVRISVDRFLDGWRVVVRVVSTGETYDGVNLHPTKEGAMREALRFADTIEGKAH